MDFSHEAGRTIADVLFATGSYVCIDLFRAARKRLHRSTINQSDVQRDFDVQLILAELGGIMHADRAYVSRYRNGDHYIDGSEIIKQVRTHEWCSRGVAPAIDKYREIPVSIMTDESELVLEAGPSYRIVGQLHDGSFRRLLELDNVFAVARAAIRHGTEAPRGFIGVDFVRHKEEPERMDALPLFANRIEQVLYRNRK